MGDSLKTAMDSVVDTVSQITSAVITTVADNVDWVQECAYKQAMLIDRIETWMTFIQGAFFAGVGAYLLIWAIGLTIKKNPSA